MLQDLTLTDASLSGGDVTVAGDFSWSVSHGIETLASPITVEGDASFSGAGEQDSQDPMTFDGTAEINGPGLLSIQDSGPAVTNNGTLTVAPGAVARGSVCCVNPDVFLNTGTVTMTAPGEGNLADMAFNDQGSVVTGPGSLLDITAGPGEFGAGADLSGGGTLQFEQGASMTLATGVSIAAGSTMTLTGNAEFFGPGTFVGGGKFSWTGGTIDGNLDVAKTIHTTVSGTTKKMLMSPGSTHALLAFHGPTTVEGAGPLEAFAADISSSGAFTIRTGATVEASACCVPPVDEFLSTGTLTVPGSTSGKANLEWMNFNDQGTVLVGAGSTLIDTVGPGEFSPGVILTGGGTLDFEQNASMTLASNVQIQSGTTVKLGLGTFLGPGSFTGAGNFAWSGGTIDGSLDVASTIDTTISGTATKNLTSPTTAPVVLAFHGATTLEGSGEVDLHGTTTLSNTGTLTMKTGTNVGAGTCCASPDQFSQQRHPHRGRRDRHGDHQQPGLQQQRHRQGHRRHTEHRHPRLQADGGVHATGGRVGLGRPADEHRRRHAERVRHHHRLGAERRHRGPEHHRRRAQDHRRLQPEEFRHALLGHHRDHAGDQVRPAQRRRQGHAGGHAEGQHRQRIRPQPRGVLLRAAVPHPQRHVRHTVRQSRPTRSATPPRRPTWFTRDRLAPAPPPRPRD